MITAAIIGRCRYWWDNKERKWFPKIKHPGGTEWAHAHEIRSKLRTRSCAPPSPLWSKRRRPIVRMTTRMISGIMWKIGRSTFKSNKRICNSDFNIRRTCSILYIDVSLWMREPVVVVLHQYEGFFFPFFYIVLFLLSLFSFIYFSGSLPFFYRLCLRFLFLCFVSLFVFGIALYVWLPFSFRVCFPCMPYASFACCLCFCVLLVFRFSCYCWVVAPMLRRMWFKYGRCLV